MLCCAPEPVIRAESPPWTYILPKVRVCRFLLPIYVPSSVLSGCRSISPNAKSFTGKGCPLQESSKQGEMFCLADIIADHLTVFDSMVCLGETISGGIRRSLRTGAGSRAWNGWSNNMGHSCRILMTSSTPRHRQIMQKTPVTFTFQAALSVCMPLHPLPCCRETDPFHNKFTLQRQKTAGVLTLLAHRVHLPPLSSLPITLSQKLCGGIREHVTQVWTFSTSSSESPMTVVAKFYDPLYFYDPVEVFDPSHIVAYSGPIEVNVYEMLHVFQGTCILRYATLLHAQGTGPFTSYYWSLFPGRT
ncbi:hypothetical protein EDD85DRAFT_578879 [Armillaria nabsnona]|nr:hypothetical protein EDD85DRAFT_578879 [Armillaria nabsnona]